MKPITFFIIGITALLFEHLWMAIIHYPLIILPTILIYPALKSPAPHNYIGPFVILACIADLFSGLHFGTISGLYIGMLAIILIARMHIQPDKSSVPIQMAVGLVFVLLFFILYSFFEKTILHQMTLITIETIGTLLMFELLSKVNEYLGKPHFLK